MLPHHFLLLDGAASPGPVVPASKPPATAASQAPAFSPDRVFLNPTSCSLSADAPPGLTNKSWLSSHCKRFLTCRDDGVFILSLVLLFSFIISLLLASSHSLLVSFFFHLQLPTTVNSTVKCRTHLVLSFPPLWLSTFLSV